MIEIKITWKNRREPTLILQSANDVTNKIVKEIEKRDTDFIWYFIQFLASTELNPGIKRFSWDQGSEFGSGIKILWAKCEISRENIYLVTL